MLFSGIFPIPAIPRTFFLDIFLARIPSLKIPFPEQTLVVLNICGRISCKPNSRKNTRIFLHSSVGLRSARSTKHWQPQCLSSSWRMPVAILSANLVTTTVIAHYMANTVSVILYFLDRSLPTCCETNLDSTFSWILFSKEFPANRLKYSLPVIFVLSFFRGLA